MIVFGDHQQRVATRPALDSLRREADAFASSPCKRAATRLLITSGELAQGLLDAAAASRGRDDWGEVEQACARLVVAAASLASRERPTSADAVACRDSLGRLAEMHLPESVTVRLPEGFAFYALDPMLYRMAARRFRAGCAAPLVVIGIRSIGVTLAAVVAEACGAAELPITVRPVGHPFRRTLDVGAALESRLLAQGPETVYAIVDEGPGLSGSSFGAVADWLEARGVGPDRIHFFPGHAGDLGPEASPPHRTRWRRLARHVVTFEEFRGQGFSGASWFDDDPEAGRCTVDDLAGGRWRAGRYRSPADWPPAHLSQERLKYRYTLRGRTWLAKFAGHGHHGESNLARAQLLAGKGWVPRPRGLRNGFLVEEWIENARPVTDRGAWLDAVAGYLAERARSLPASSDTPGASPQALFEMIAINVAERFGPRAAEALEPWKGRLGRISGAIRRVITDNRMHAWEWLALPDGRCLKADALEHAEAHDLIGAQDLAWDVVGACVEMDLDEGEREWLETRLARDSPFRADPALREFSLLAYLAFQMGYYSMASSAHASDPEEARRLEGAADRYARLLSRTFLDGESPRQDAGRAPTRKR